MKSLIVWLCLAFFILGGFLDAAAQWDTTTIASAGKNQQSRHPQIARDGNGALHIVFSGDRTKKPAATYNLFYTNNISGSFGAPVQITSFGGNGISTSRTELAIDSNGAVHIFFVESESFYYMTNVGGSFGSAVLLASGGFAGGDIAVDGANHVHVIFSQLSSNGYHVFYTNNSGGSFQPATNLTASYPTYSNQSPRIALDTDNNVHLVMHSLATGGAPVFDPDLAEIFYINNIGGSFPSTTPTQITSNSGNPDGARLRTARLAIDGMDVIHIIFGTTFYNPYPNYRPQRAYLHGRTALVFSSPRWRFTTFTITNWRSIAPAMPSSPTAIHQIMIFMSRTTAQGLLLPMWSLLKAEPSKRSQTLWSMARLCILRGIVLRAQRLMFSMPTTIEASHPPASVCAKY